MSTSARVRASQKYKSRLSSERGGYEPRIGTPMSGAERARQFRERLKAAKSCLLGLKINYLNRNGINYY